MSDLPYDFEGRAAEYVLGVLPIGEARLLEREMLSNPALAQAVARWEQRLAPLATAVAPVTPPADLWPRIEKELPAGTITNVITEAAPSAPTVSILEDAPPPPVVKDASPPTLQAPAKPVAGLPPWITAKRPDTPNVVALQRPGLWNNTTFLRAGTVGGLALAAVLALFAIIRAPEPPQYHAAIVAMERPGATWMAETMPDGRIKVIAMTAIERPPNSDLELWALPKGTTRPIAMGVIPRSGVMMVEGHDMPMDGLQLLVSLEPPGGSPTGSPTGPVLYGGTLRVAKAI